MTAHLDILDLDGSTLCADSSQGQWRSRRVCRLRDLGPSLRLWSTSRTMDRARQRLREQPGTSAPTVTLVGSGDFHHLTALLLERMQEPVTVVHFDNHPDWVRLAPRWHCGSWVNQALRNPAVVRVITVGPCSDDLGWPAIEGGNLRALADGRIVMFPWRRSPSRVLRRIPDGAGHTYQKGHLFWRNLDALTSQQAAASLLAQITTEAIWLTIDKDVLSEHEGISNWDQGMMPLQSILLLIHALGRTHRIAGADICGEYAAPDFSNSLKRIEAFRDHPRRHPDEHALAINAAVNRQLLAAIAQAIDAC